ncbi:MAG: GGDEF domain-containing protein [Peptostreptococcaceae bacterium]|nr:GGDEF domain-containing protein [Peptostreptococcaceae bacterium]
MKNFRNQRISERKVTIVISGSIIIALMITNMLIFDYIYEIQGDAKLINYTGLLRGGTQRLVKLEASGSKNNGIALELENIAREIRHSKEKGNIYSKNGSYREKFEEMDKVWDQIQDEIIRVRGGGSSERLYLLSEKHYRLANEATYIAEHFSENKLVRITNVRQAMMIGSVLMVIIYCIQVLAMIRLENRNKELGIRASIDQQTGMPNRGECDAMLEYFSARKLPPELMVMAIDLNGLKKLNDNYGHSVGDVLIRSFGKILMRTAKNYGFVGRNGGDEFLGLFESCSESKFNKFRAELQESVEIFNARNGVVKISFALGNASSQEEIDNIYDLIRLADKRMYQNKSEMAREQDGHTNQT